MKTYREIEGSRITDGKKCIPMCDDNSDYSKALSEVEAGEAEILPYVAPEPSFEERNATQLAQLAAIDLKTARPVRELSNNASDVDARNVVEQLEAEAQAIRATMS